MSHQPLALVPLGSDGLVGSRIGIGTWAIGGGWGPQPEERSLEALHQALACGCHLIDTAPLYGNGRAERLIARVFREEGRRVTTLTKIAPRAYHWAPAPDTPMRDLYPPEHIIAEAEGSLRRLETDCLDCLLFQTWCPTWGQETDWYETMRLLQTQGKIRTFGISVSDHRPDEANEVIQAGHVEIIEAPYSILDQRAAERLFPLALLHHVSIIARTPLASGALSGCWQEDQRFHRADWRRRVFYGELLQRTLQRVAQVQAVLGAEVRLSPAAIQFCLSHPAVTTVISGLRSGEQAMSNLAPGNQEPLAQEILDRLVALWNRELCTEVRTSIGAEGEG